jgi:hypothetical protein
MSRDLDSRTTTYVLQKFLKRNNFPQVSGWITKKKKSVAEGMKVGIKMFNLKVRYRYLTHN